jgi:uncharacterized lipoprotein YajG
LNLQIDVIEGIVAASFLSATVVPMLNRFAPLVPLALVTLLFGCAAHPQQVVAAKAQATGSKAKFVAAQSSSVYEEEVATEKELAHFPPTASLISCHCWPTAFSSAACP